MTKADLRTGMVITCRNNARYLVLSDASTSRDCSKFFAIGKGRYSWIDLENFNEDLTFDDSNAWDIIEVEEFDMNAHIFSFFTEINESWIRTIWTRPEKKKYTYAQLKEILGEEFEIVKE